NGNGWTLALISTNLLSFEKESKQRKLQTFFSPYCLFQQQVFYQIFFSLSRTFCPRLCRPKGGSQIANQRSVCNLERKNKRSLGELSASAGSEPCAVYF